MQPRPGSSTHLRERPSAVPPNSSWHGDNGSDLDSLSQPDSSASFRGQHLITGHRDARRTWCHTVRGQHDQCGTPPASPSFTWLLCQSDSTNEKHHQSNRVRNLKMRGCPYRFGERLAWLALGHPSYDSCHHQRCTTDQEDPCEWFRHFCDQPSFAWTFSFVASKLV